MTEVENVWDNMFLEPKLSECKQEVIVDEQDKRYRLLDYDDVMKLSAVMETTVPIDGKGNFPSLEVTPSTLVQVRWFHYHGWFFLYLHLLQSATLLHFLNLDFCGRLGYA